MIIGNLNAGDYTVASFGLQSTQMRQSTANQTRNRDVNQNNLKIQIAYTDTMGKREFVEKEISVNLQALMTSLSTDSQTTGSQTTMTSFRGRQQKSFFSKYRWYIAILVVLAIFGVAYWKYRKEKKLDPHFRKRDLLKIKNIFKKKKK